MRLRTLVPALLCPALLAAVEPAGVTFKDITAQAGIAFVHNNGAFGKKWMPETYGSGCVFFDMDADGRQDLLLVNGSRFPGQPGEVTTSRLYRNLGGGRFADVTKGSGLDVELYGMGGAAGDFDNDGLVDLAVTDGRGVRLYRNLGGGRFADATERNGIVDKEWSSSVMWFDYDKDGALDLAVARYLQWSPSRDVHCNNTGRGKSYCTPDMYKGEGLRLYHNRGNGTFTDVTREAGVFTSNARSLGLAMLDYDGDGWMDFFVANDGTPNQLFRNAGNGTFVDAAFKAGVAVRENGSARAGMGVDAADYDGSGRPSVIVGNFSHEMLAVYHNEGNGLFIDEAPRSNLGKETLLSLTFGLFFFDYDLDGRPDIFAANGHITDDFPAFIKNVTYAQRPHLFRNLDGRRFEEAIDSVGPDLARKVVGRGAAYADVDEDGDLDVVMTESHGPARLYRNDGGVNHALRVRVVGVTSNRDGIGARVDVTRLDGSKAWALVKSGSSYLSQSELPVTFGLGAASKVQRLSITWPDGTVQPLGPQDADRTLIVREGVGIVSRKAFARRSR